MIELGYRFKDEGLLAHALIHSSYANEKKMDISRNNQRLEFLGDAVLELTVSDYIYAAFPNFTEGELTKLRASVVCEPMLAKLARQIQLGGMISMGKGEEQTGGRNRDSILSDTLEAVIGAIYLDGGSEESRKFIMGLLGKEIEAVTKNSWAADCKTFLQEQLQKTSKEPIEYVTVKDMGPDHDKTFVVRLSHGGRFLSEGEGKSKKEAEQNAAFAAIKKLGYGNDG